jgi:hypothetical protein
MEEPELADDFHRGDVRCARQPSAAPSSTTARWPARAMREQLID